MKPLKKLLAGLAVIALVAFAHVNLHAEPQPAPADEVMLTCTEGCPAPNLKYHQCMNLCRWNNPPGYDCEGLCEDCIR